MCYSKYTRKDIMFFAKQNIKMFIDEMNELWSAKYSSLRKLLIQRVGLLEHCAVVICYIRAQITHC